MVIVDDETERSKRELEIEAVGYIVGRYFGLDTSGSAFYLAAWEGDDEVRKLYDQYQTAESDAERHEIALEMGKLDGRRHAEIYAALEDE
ncbi:hypothetical protein [Natrinema amylolyticum]|uniref:hypothetical protein n=1 Tax=Natrinema amylolyticum TaxID=2878679 RepID=UPI003CCD5FD7